MSLPSTAATNASVQAGTVRYLHQDAAHSLYRNGQVLTRRDRDGNDAGTEGMIFDTRQITAHNARLLAPEQRCTLTNNGFELVTQGLANRAFDFFDHNSVVGTYYDECAQSVKQATGAHQVFAFDHNVRSANDSEAKQRIAGGQQVQGPARIVHGDYTLTSAPQRLRDLAKPPTGNDTLRSILKAKQSLLDNVLVERILGGAARYAIINVWRNIAEQAVATHPLALCDARSVQPEDLVVFEIHYADRVGENYFSKHSTHHDWYYYPRMTRDEILLIKQWDSAGTMAQTMGAQADGHNDQAPCTFSFHTAFLDASVANDAPQRLSIEVRCVVLYA